MTKEAMQKVDNEVAGSREEQSKAARPKRDVGRIITVRDEMLKTSLYAAQLLTTEQIAKMYFPSQAYLDDPDTDKSHYSVGSAKVRLYALRGEGYVLTDRYTPLGETKPVRYWYLTRRRYKREAAAFGRRNERYPDVPTRLTHHFKATEIYARIHPRFEELFARLDPYEYPEWQWVGEGHASREYHFEGKTKKHQPDAEIHLPNGQVCILERQTKEAKQPPAVVKNKVVRARNYAEYMGYPHEQVKLLFACDTERDRGYAREALKEGGIAGVLGDPETIVKYLLTRARELAESAGEAA